MTDATTLVPADNASTPNPFDSLPRQRSIDLFDLDGNFKTLEQLKLEILEAVVEECNGSMSEAARALHIGRSTLYRLI